MGQGPRGNKTGLVGYSELGWTHRGGDEQSEKMAGGKPLSHSQGVE